MAVTGNKTTVNKQQQLKTQQQKKKPAPLPTGTLKQNKGDQQLGYRPLDINSSTFNATPGPMPTQPTVPAPDYSMPKVDTPATPQAAGVNAPGMVAMPEAKGFFSNFEDIPATGQWTGAPDIGGDAGAALDASTDLAQGTAGAMGDMLGNIGDRPDYSGVPQLAGSYQDFEGNVFNDVYTPMKDELDAQTEQQGLEFEQNMANRGIPVGSELYNRLKTELSSNQSKAYNQAMATAQQATTERIKAGGEYNVDAFTSGNTAANEKFMTPIKGYAEMTSAMGEQLKPAMVEQATDYNAALQNLQSTNDMIKAAQEGRIQMSQQELAGLISQSQSLQDTVNSGALQQQQGQNQFNNTALQGQYDIAGKQQDVIGQLKTINQQQQNALQQAGWNAQLQSYIMDLEQKQKLGQLNAQELATLNQMKTQLSSDLQKINAQGKYAGADAWAQVAAAQAAAQPGIMNAQLNSQQWDWFKQNYPGMMAGSGYPAGNATSGAT